MNGKLVKIWQIHWLPWKHPPLVSSTMITSLDEATIDILIDVDSRQWNPDLVDGIFTPEEAALIKKIQLERCEAKDSLFWPLTQDGNYSSKSGYRFLKEEVEVWPLADSKSHDTGLWKGI